MSRTLFDVIEGYNANPQAAGYVKDVSLDNSLKPHFVLGQRAPIGYSGEQRVTLQLRLHNSLGEIAYTAQAWDAHALVQAVEAFLLLMRRPA